MLDSLSAPVDADDQRTGPERRVDAIDQLCQQILDAGLPSDKGVRPHVSVTADAETVHAAATHTRGTTSDPMVPADLAGFGPIGPELLSMIGCTADVTPILTHQMPDFSQDRVLNVGRTHRLADSQATPRSSGPPRGPMRRPRAAATPTWRFIMWSGGPAAARPTWTTLIGLCSRCHHLVHRELLVVRADGIGGFVFTDHDNRAIQASFRRRRAAYQEAIRIHQVSRAINRRRAQRASA